MQEIKSIQDFTNTTQDSLNKGKLVVINFLAEWAAECGQVNDVLEELSKQLPHVVFLKVEAEKVQDLSEKFRIEVVPTCVLYKNGAEVARVEGANAPELSSKVKQHSIQAPPLPTGGDPKEALNQRLKQIINQARIMLFMKGSPQEPRCGFSRQIVGLLNETGVEYGSFDILSDEEVRQGLKELSNWPTYPQVYVKGELIGGLDIVREMKESGELEESLNA